MCVYNVRNYVISTLQDMMLLETVPDVTHYMPFTNSAYFNACHTFCSTVT